MLSVETCYSVAQAGLELPFCLSLPQSVTPGVYPHTQLCTAGLHDSQTHKLLWVELSVQ